MTLSVIPLLHR